MKKQDSHRKSNVQGRKGMKWRMTALAIVVFHSLLFFSCSTIDCPFNAFVYSKYKLAGDVEKLSDYLTVSINKIDGTDNDLLNSITEVDSFMLPMSYSQPEDVLYFNRTSGEMSVKDTVVVKKQNIPHFESIDCNPAYFHRIENVRYTHHGIDSIVILNKNVTYDDSKTHFQIYFKILSQ